MRTISDYSNKGLSTSKLHICSIIVLCVLLLFIMPSCRKRLEESKPLPPDLSRCTSIEFQYKVSLLKMFLNLSSKEQSIINSDENKYLESLNKIVLDDPERIKAFAQNIALSSYIGPVKGEPAVIPIVHVFCYDKTKRIMSFNIRAGDIDTEDGQLFRLQGGSGIKELKLPREQIKPFKLRADCAHNLSKLHGMFSTYFRKKYPTPTEWCDSIVLQYKNVGMLDQYIKKPFICPSAGEGKCHYAMNPNCRPKSPLDTVLLFETKAGWNQNGGPELFTFDNHDPRGGCVLLNDGTVKFIRTEEELHSLRWK